MATVRDKADIRGRIDLPYSYPNRKVTVSPANSLPPLYVNEIVHDTTNLKWWRATDITINGWVTIKLIDNGTGGSGGGVYKQNAAFLFEDF